MKRKTRVLALALCAMLLTGTMAGCLSAGAASDDLMQGVNAQSADVSDGLTDAAVSSFAAFSVRLFQESVKSEPGNTAVSPLSVLLALGMAANGAQGNTLTEFTQLLGERGLSLDEINRAAAALSAGFRETGGSTALNIANAIWYDEGFNPEQAFLQANGDYYQAAAYRADFSKSGTVDDINDWVSERTNELIPSIIDQLDPQAIMVLLNTVYFNAVWQNQFNPDKNSEDGFTLDDGSTADVIYMSNGVSGENYIGQDGMQGVLRPYDDGRFAYLAVLPPADTDVDDFIASFDADTVKALIESASEQAVLLQLPKYEATSDLSLNEMLTGMGLRDAFDTAAADFGAMGSAGGNIYIGEVIHKTKIRVNEKGTEAAAATGIVMEVTGAIENFITLRFDRPFVYAIVDLSSGLPLFFGVMKDPSQRE